MNYWRLHHCLRGCRDSNNYRWASLHIYHGLQWDPFCLSHSIRTPRRRCCSMYIFVGLVFMLWHRKMYITHKATDKFPCLMQGSNSQRSDWGIITSCHFPWTLVSHVTVTVTKRHLQWQQESNTGGLYVHDDVITRKRFPPSVTLCEEDPPDTYRFRSHGANNMKLWYLSWLFSLNKILNKQPNCRFFKTPWWSCYIIAMNEVDLFNMNKAMSTNFIWITSTAESFMKC